MLPDYIPRREAVTFDPDETQRSVTINIIDDAVYEGPESFMVSLSPVSPGVLVGTSLGWVTILDEEDCEYQNYSISYSARGAVLIIDFISFCSCGIEVQVHASSSRGI